MTYKGYDIRDVGGGKWYAEIHNPNTGQTKVWIASLNDIKAEIDRKEALKA